MIPTQPSLLDLLAEQAPPPATHCRIGYPAIRPYPKTRETRELVAA